MVEVPVEKVLGHLPKGIRDDLVSNIEKKVVKMKNDEEESKFGIVMRSNRDFFYFGYG